MYLQNIHSALEIRQLHRYPAVKASRTKQCGIQLIRLIGGRQNDDGLRAVEAIHLRQKLIQGLLPLVIAAEAGAAALLADGIDLIDEDDAGRLLLGLLKEVANLRCTHAHKHFHKFRAGYGEEGNTGLACHGLRQQGLTGSGRTHKKGTLRDLRTNL